MVSRFAIFAVVLAAFASLSEDANARPWKDNAGRKIEAKFVRIHQGRVVLMQGKKVLQVPFENLSEEDQDYLRDELEKKGQENLIPDVSTMAKGMNPSVQGTGMMPPGPSMMPSPGTMTRSGDPLAAAQARMLEAMQRMQASQVASSRSGIPAASIASSYSPSMATTSSAPSTAPYNPTAPYVPPATTTSNPPPTQSAASYNGNSMASASTAATASYSPPTMPTMPTMHQPTFEPPRFEPPTMPSVPTMEYVEQKQCMECKNIVPSTSRAGDKCPHCGVTWDYYEDENGVKRDRNGGVYRYRFGGIIGLIIAAVGFLIKKLKG